MSRRYVTSVKKPLQNPFKYAIGSSIRRWRHFWIGSGGLLFTAALYWVFVSPAFALTTVRIEANLSLPHERVKEILAAQFSKNRFLFVSQRNIFTFNAAEFKNMLRSEFAINNINLRKNLPNRINVTLSEKPRRAVWATLGRIYALDAAGAIIGRIDKTGVGDIVIYDRSGSNAELGQNALDAKTLAAIATMYTSSQLQGLRVQFVSVDKQDPGSVTLRVQQGWDVYFAAGGLIESQLKNLELTLAHTIPADKRTDLEYIDLRFGEKVYFKYKE